MSGVQVLIINQQIGFQSGGITQSNGRFLVVELRAGGPSRLGDLIPAWQGGDVRLFVNIYNALDELYISDATDNSSYSGFEDDHDADDTEVYLGQPRMFNLGFEIKF